jgi:hypothetical protein
MVDVEAARLHASWVGAPVTEELEPDVMEAARLYWEMNEAVDELHFVSDGADW